MRFTTNAYPKEQRRDAWRFALQRHSIDLVDMADEALYGELVSFRSEIGIDFIRLTATRQSISINLVQQPDMVWLTLILDGRAAIRFGPDGFEVEGGDIVHGAATTATLHAFADDHRILFVRIPREVLSHRLRTALPGGVGKLAGDAAATRVFAGMLGSVADTLDDATPDQLRPVELGLPEFLLAGLLDNAPPRALGGAAGIRAALLERIFQTIEMKLADSDLTLQQVASEHGISPRYLQKLFETVEESFSHFVKLRRLERCRLDLRSPLHAQKSISDILFEWGFNDSASFSRAFRERYGVSPREYRKGAPTVDDQGEQPQRGSPAGRREARARAAAAEDADRPDIPATPEPAISGPGVRHHFLPVGPETVHWGFFSRSLKPVLEVRSGDYVTIETLTHHANDDPERMIEGDDGAESVYRWTAEGRAVERRGAGPIDASAFGRGPGEGFGVHICTGPIAITDARPGDVVEVRILDIRPRHTKFYAT